MTSFSPELAQHTACPERKAVRLKWNEKMQELLALERTRCQALMLAQCSACLANPEIAVICQGMQAWCQALESTVRPCWIRAQRTQSVA
jgi:hypothetical protein